MIPADDELEALAARLDEAARSTRSRGATAAAWAELHDARVELYLALRRRGGPWRRRGLVYSTSHHDLMVYAEGPDRTVPPRWHAHNRPRSVLGARARHLRVDKPRLDLHEEVDD